MFDRQAATVSWGSALTCGSSTRGCHGLDGPNTDTSGWLSNALFMLTWPSITQRWLKIKIKDLLKVLQSELTPCLAGDHLDFVFRSFVNRPQTLGNTKETQKENSSTIKSHAVSLDGDMLPVRQSQTGPSFKNLDTQLECERFLLSKSFFVAVRCVYSLPNKPFQDCILWTFAVPIQGTEPVWRGTRSIQRLSWLPISSDVAGVVTCFVTHAVIMR